MAITAAAVTEQINAGIAKVIDDITDKFERKLTENDKEIARLRNELTKTVAAKEQLEKGKKPMPICTPRPFKTGGNFEEYCAAWLKWATFSNIPKKHLLGVLTTFLDESTQARIDALGIQKNEMDSENGYERHLPTISKALQPHHSQEKYENKLIRVKQRQNEELSKYLERVVKLLRNAKIELTSVSRLGQNALMTGMRNVGLRNQAMTEVKKLGDISIGKVLEIITEYQTGNVETIFSEEDEYEPQVVHALAVAQNTLESKIEQQTQAVHSPNVSRDPQEMDQHRRRITYCHLCRQPHHIKFACPNRPCMFCGGDHKAVVCPQAICGICNEDGHTTHICPEKGTYTPYDHDRKLYNPDANSEGPSGAGSNDFMNENYY